MLVKPTTVRLEATVARSERLALIEEIQRKRGSSVISYITSDRRNLQVPMAGDVLPILHQHIVDLELSDSPRIDLVIYSRGGDSNVPWTIASMFREYSKGGSFSVLIPYRAHSAATMVAIGADEIVMSRKAELGPIDITMQGPHNEVDAGGNPKPISVEDVMGFMALAKEVVSDASDHRAQAFRQLADRVHPLALGKTHRSRQQTELVAMRLLSTRAAPLDDERNAEIARQLASKIFSHEHTVSRSEAIEKLGIEFITPAEDADIDHELWDLYREYEAIFSLNAPFDPDSHMIATGAQEHVWDDLPIACVESISRLDVARQSIRVRAVRAVPPQIQLNLNNLSMPTINVPQLPPGITAAELQQLVQQLVSQLVPQAIRAAVDQASDRFLSSLPLTGYQRIAYRARWEQEG